MKTIAEQPRSLPGGAEGAEGAEAAEVVGSFAPRNAPRAYRQASGSISLGLRHHSGGYRGRCAAHRSFKLDGQNHTTPRNLSGSPPQPWAVYKRGAEKQGIGLRHALKRQMAASAAQGGAGRRGQSLHDLHPTSPASGREGGVGPIRAAALQLARLHRALVPASQSLFQLAGWEVRFPCAKVPPVNCIKHRLWKQAYRLQAMAWLASIAVTAAAAALAAAAPVPAAPLLLVLAMFLLLASLLLLPLLLLLVLLPLVALGLSLVAQKAGEPCVMGADRGTSTVQRAGCKKCSMQPHPGRCLQDGQGLRSGGDLRPACIARRRHCRRPASSAAARRAAAAGHPGWQHGSAASAPAQWGVEEGVVRHAEGALHRWRRVGGGPKPRMKPQLSTAALIPNPPSCWERAWRQHAAPCQETPCGWDHQGAGMARLASQS